MPFCNGCQAPIRFTSYQKGTPPSNVDGTRHNCNSSVTVRLPAPVSAPPPINPVIDVAKLPVDNSTLADIIQKLANIAVESSTSIMAKTVLDQVTQYIQHQIKSDATEHVRLRSQFDRLVTDTLVMAREEVKSLLPQQHVIKVLNLSSITTIEGKPHKNFAALVQFASLGKHCFLSGPAGSGKTVAARMLAKALNRNYIEKNLGPATNEWNLTGFQHGITGEHIPGILEYSVTNGGIVMLDEADTAHPSIMPALSVILSNKPGELVFFNGKGIPLHKDFVCIMGANTWGFGADLKYAGATRIDGRVLNRFAKIAWDYDEEAELDWAGRDQVAWTKYVQSVRHGIFKLGLQYILSPRQSINGADCLRHGMDKSTVEQAYIWGSITLDDKAKILREVR